MHIFSAILFAVSANMDNLPLGIAYGIRGIRISFARNLLIAFITSAGTLLSMSLGAIITLFLKKETAAMIGCSILILMGLWFIAGFFRKRLKTAAPAEEPSIADPLPADSASRPEETAGCPACRQKSFMTTRQSLTLALVLMINNIGFGIGANIAGLPILLTSLCTFFCSLVLLVTGVKIGLKFHNDRLSSYSELISGILIVTLGIYEFFI